METHTETAKSHERRKRLLKATKSIGGAALVVSGASAVLGGGVGIIATEVAPHTTSIDGVKVSASISNNIHKHGKIFEQTPFGSFEAKSKYWFAPGIDISPDITPGDIDASTQLLGRIQRDPRERNKVIDTIVTDQAENIALRFMLGAGLTASVLAGGYELYKRRGEVNSWKHSTAALGRGAVASTAGTAVCLVELLGMGTAYQYSNMDAPRATGILAQAMGSPDALRSIDRIQTKELLPYLNGLLSLNKQVQERIASPETQAPTAINLLFVSDIHGRNRYPFMKDLVSKLDINAVVDTGDLINFGFAQELGLTDLPSGVKSLGVPYLYVTGNHDSQGTNDFSVINALKKGAPNVIALQPDQTTYQKVSIGGYTIAGMDDQAHYYTDGVDNETDSMQTPFVKRFDQAFQNIPLDLAIAHEPSATNQMDVGIFKANGHTHKAALIENSINPGTFTGGDELRSAGSYTDALTKFLQCKVDTKDTEGCTPPSESPSSYAVLSVGEDCRPNTLTIYQYVIENGRVTNTVVTAYNLSDLTSSDTIRTCDMSQGISVQTVQAK